MATTCPMPRTSEVTEVWPIDLTAVTPGPLPAADHLMAARFQVDADARRWRASRWALRWVLGQYVGLAPEEVPLVRGRWGKPVLADGPSFNLSTTAHDAVIVVRDSGWMGVDLQIAPVDPDDLYTVVDGPLAPADATSPQARWARLEAVLKCLGRGLSLPVPATLVAALGTAQGRTRVGHQTVWWRDLPHRAGHLCIAADTPLNRVVEHAPPDRLSGWRRPMASTCPIRDRSCPGS